MNEPFPTLGTPAGSSGITEEMHRFTLMVQRIVDADLLPSDEGAALLAEIGSARISLDAGDDEAARQHVERLALFADSLLQSGALDALYGRAIVESAHRILEEGVVD